ncbi:MAG: hypothetical protein PHG45_05960, partial [Dehalococcoidales bacterium]|nr:hypothetical protein [Dehalococcoidales bacterium]
PQHPLTRLTAKHHGLVFIYFKSVLKYQPAGQISHRWVGVYFFNNSRIVKSKVPPITNIMRLLAEV